MNTLYAVLLCIIVVAALAAVAIVLGNNAGIAEQKAFARLDQDTQRQLYGTPVVYEDETRRTWHQKGYVHKLHPHDNDDNADVEILWYNANAPKAGKNGKHKEETNVARLTMRKADVKSRQLHEGDMVTIHVDPARDDVTIAER